MDDFPQSINTPTMKGVLTKADTKSIAVYTINGVRRPAGEKLPNGLIFFKLKEKLILNVFISFLNLVGGRILCIK